MNCGIKKYVFDRSTNNSSIYCCLGGKLTIKGDNAYFWEWIFRNHPTLGAIPPLRTNQPPHVLRGRLVQIKKITTPLFFPTQMAWNATQRTGNSFHSTPDSGKRQLAARGGPPGRPGARVLDDQTENDRRRPSAPADAAWGPSICYRQLSVRRNLLKIQMAFREAGKNNTHELLMGEIMPKMESNGSHVRRFNDN